MKKTPRTKASAITKSSREDELFTRVAAILDEARSHVARAVNTAMVHAYWLIGREIVEVEQHGAGRAAYGEELLKKLAARLAQRFGKGFNLTGLKRMRQFYRAFPEGSALPAELGGPDKGAAARHLSRPASKGAPARHPSLTAAGPLFPPILSWTHYRLLLSVDKPEARSFYEIEAARESWSCASWSARSRRCCSSVWR